MSNYTKTVDFASKDALTTGNAAKLILGTALDDEFDAIAAAIASKLDASGVTYNAITLTGVTSLNGTLSGSGTIDGGTY